MSIESITQPPASSEYSILIQGSLVKSSDSEYIRTGGGLRGRINGESRYSRRRLQKKLARVDLKFYSGVLFLTLTFPDVPSIEKQKQMLRGYLEWLKRRFGKVPVIWRWEQGAKSGRDHFHLVVFAKDFIRQEIYQNAWVKLGGGFVWVEFVDSARACRYITKYISKGAGSAVKYAESWEKSLGDVVPLSTSHIITEKKEWTGRTWGYRYYSAVRMAEILSIPLLNRRDFTHISIKLRRFIRSWNKSERYRRGKYYLEKIGKWYSSMDKVYGLLKGLPEMQFVYRLLFGKSRFLCGSNYVSWSAFVPQDENFQGALYRWLSTLERQKDYGY